MRSPLTIVTLLYMSGIVIGHYVTLPLLILFTFSAVAAIAALCVRRGREFFLAALLVFFGWTNQSASTAVLSPFDLRLILPDAPQIMSVRGKLVETPEQRLFVRDSRPSWRSLARVQVSEIGRDSVWRRAEGRIAISTPGVLETNFFAGQRVEINGILDLPKAPAAPGLFDYRAFLRQQGIYYLLQVERTNDWHLVERPDSPLARPWSDRFRDWAQRTLAKGLPEEDEPLRLLWAMVLGWKPGLTQEMAQPFMRSGTLHIFAISGLHIALIAGILASLLRVFQVPRGGCGLVVIPLIWFYTAATGWQASAIRSTVMMTIIIGGWALERPSRLLNSLAGAGLVILVWEPSQLFQAGFQLSFFVVLGLALIAPPFEKIRQWWLQPDPLLPEELRPKWQQWWRAAVGSVSAGVATSLAAWLGSLPLIAYYFYLITPVSLGANLVIVPLSSLALASSLGSLVCGDWLPWGAELFNHSSWFWMKLMIALSEVAAELPKAFFYVRPPTLMEAAIYYAVLALSLSGWIFAARRRIWAVPMTFLMAGVAVFSFFRPSPQVKITVLPLGGSGILAQAPGTDSDLIIDCGDDSAADWMLKPFLRAQGINYLPNLLLTHGALHHVNGYESLLADFPVQTVLTNTLRFRSQAYRRVVERLRAGPPASRPVHRGDRIGQWRVLHPEASDRFARADDAAVVLLGEFDGGRVLCLSNLGRAGQDLLLEREADLRADVVIAGLPRQGEPLREPLLAAIAPQVIVIASADYPVVCQMNRALRERLEATETPLISTATTGAATLIIGPSRWEVGTMSGIHLQGAASQHRSPKSQTEANKLDKIQPGNRRRPTLLGRKAA